MTQGERIREVRKTLGLTLEKFGEKIGMKKNSVSQIENGKNSVTEQVVKSICREFNVDYIWLTSKELTASWQVRAMPARIFSRHYLRQVTRTSQHFKES